MIPAPLGTYLKFAYTIESIGAFLLSDGEKVVLLRTDGSIDLIANLDGEPYQWGGVGADFEVEILQRRVNGFKSLTRYERQRLKESAIYKSTRNIPIVNYAHDDVILFFAGKSIALLKWVGEELVELKRTRTKGRDPIRWALAPEQNMLLYGTNYGELYSQTFGRDCFIKSVKVDQLPNTCYQITFSPDGRRMFAGGLGFIRSYTFDGSTFTPDMSIATAMRSFELVEDYIIINKGIHGLDVIRVKDKPERVTSLDLPFMIDKMYFLAPQKALLLISGNTSDWALFKLSC